MKDITISAKRQKCELLSLVVCFLIAFGLNAYAVVKYGAPAIELVKSIGFVLVTTAVLYILWTLVRLIVCGLRRAFGTSKK